MGKFTQWLVLSIIIQSSVIYTLVLQFFKYDNKKQSNKAWVAQITISLYLLITPLFLPYINKYYTQLVEISNILTSIACFYWTDVYQSSYLSLVIPLMLILGLIASLSTPFTIRDIYKIESAHIFVSFSLFFPVIFSKLMVLNQVIQISQISMKGNTADTEIDYQSLQTKSFYYIIQTIGIVNAAFSFLLLNFIQNDQITDKYIESNYNNSSFNQKYGRIILEFNHINYQLVVYGLIFGFSWLFPDLINQFLSQSKLPDLYIALFDFLTITATFVLSLSFRNITNLIITILTIGLLGSLILDCVQIFSFSYNEVLMIMLSKLLIQVAFSTLPTFWVLQNLLKYEQSEVMISLLFYVANLAYWGNTIIFKKINTLFYQNLFYFMPGIVWIFQVFICIGYYKQPKKINQLLKQFNQNCHRQQIQ